MMPVSQIQQVPCWLAIS